MSKRALLAGGFLAIAGGLLAAATWRPSTDRGERAEHAARAQGAEQRATQYYCPMHPSYRSDRPGDCPVCNMKLIPLEAGAGAAGLPVAGRGVVTITPEQRALIGVRTAAVERKPARKAIRAAGRVEVDERGLSAVNLKVGGWVEELFVKSAGERVERGDPLLALWSPELYEAQQSYLLLHRALAARAETRERALEEEAARAARERLLLWDLTEEQVAALEAGQEPERRTTIHSRVAGVVMRRDVTLGTYVEPGRDLFELADLSRVWVQADVYEHESAGLRTGLEAEVEIFSLPGQRFAGAIAYLYPYLDESTRTQRVRLEIPNEDGRLKPGMYGAVSIQVDLGEQVVIDDSAVLDTGTRALVFVEREEGRLEPREVGLGARGEGWVVVHHGLEPGERVVTSGTFLVDSESRLRAALLEHAGMPGMEGMHEVEGTKPDGQPPPMPEHRH